MKQCLPTIAVLLFGVAVQASAQPPNQRTRGATLGEAADVFPTPIAQVPTAIPAFIGITSAVPRGPAAFRKVSSLAEYEELFGKDADKNAYLYASMKLFYANGGGEARVYSVGTSPAHLTRQALLDAFTALNKEVGPTLILFPDAVNLSPNDFGAVQQAALAQCAQLRNRFCILDVATPDGLAKASDPQSGFRAKIGANNRYCGAAYGPWLKVTPGDGPSQVPASGAIAGVYAAVDRTRGVWAPPANVTLRGVAGLTETIDDRAQEKLTNDPSGVSLNVVRNFPGKDHVVWGARTVDGGNKGSQWRYVPAWRLRITVEESIRRATASVVFEPNTETTWVQLKAKTTTYLNDLWKQGGLVGTKPEEAYYVNIGRTSMTPRDIEAGRLIIEIGIATTRPLEFSVFTIQHQMAAP